MRFLGIPRAPGWNQRLPVWGGLRSFRILRFAKHHSRHRSDGAWTHHGFASGIITASHSKSAMSGMTDDNTFRVGPERIRIGLYGVDASESAQRWRAGGPAECAERGTGSARPMTSRRGPQGGLGGAGCGEGTSSVTLAARNAALRHRLERFRRLPGKRGPDYPRI